MSVKVTWRGAAVQRTQRRRAAKVLVGVGSAIAKEASQKLRPGQAGYDTGKLARSYTISSSEANPVPATADTILQNLRLYVGSWLDYAKHVELGHHSFKGQFPLLNAFREVKSQVRKIIRDVSKA